MPSETTLVLLVRPDASDHNRFRAWCPDLPDWYATGATMQEAVDLGSEIVRAVAGGRWADGFDAATMVTAAVPVNVHLGPPHDRSGDVGSEGDGMGRSDRETHLSGEDSVGEETSKGEETSVGSAVDSNDKARSDGRVQPTKSPGADAPVQWISIEAGSSRRQARDVDGVESVQGRRNDGMGYTNRAESFSATPPVFSNPYERDGPDA